MLQLITIAGNTPETRNFTPSSFIIADSLNDLRILSYNSDMGGLFDRPELTGDRLNAHVKAMQEEGFTVTVNTVIE